MTRVQIADCTRHQYPLAVCVQPVPGPTVQLTHAASRFYWHAGRPSPSLLYPASTRPRHSASRHSASSHRRSCTYGALVPAELLSLLGHGRSRAVAISLRSAHNAQYVDAPYTRPHDYTVYPFCLTWDTKRCHAHEPHSDCLHCTQSAVLSAQLDRAGDTFSTEVHRGFMRALRGSKAFTLVDPLDPHSEAVATAPPVWRVGDFTVDCLLDGSEVMRHRHEGVWTNHPGAQWRPQLTTTGHAAQQDYLFGVPCDPQAALMDGEGLGSGVAMSCSSAYHHRPAGIFLPHEFRLVHHWPPIYDTEHMAYGFVHQWIRVRQGSAQTVIACVGILSSEKSEFTFNRTWIRRFPADEAVRLTDRASVVPREQRQDLFLPSHFIAQRITAAPLPLPNDAAWLVAPIR